jgi:hypothetical protein
MIRKHIYKWHRTASVIISVPVLLWALSGFMHPLMTNIRPKLATQFLQPQLIDSSKITMPLETALRQNHIDSFTSFRIVHIEDNWFYQVQLKHNSEPVYLATLNGKILTAGNWLYAQYLGKQFLEGQSNNSSVKMPGPAPSPDQNAAHDCCDAAASCVVNNKTGAKITDASLVTGFNSEYKTINRFLPVYRISFNRPDGIRIYVDPTTDRFAFAMDNKRRVFDQAFTLVHTWAWLYLIGKGKLIIEFLLVGLAFLTTVMGIYIFFSTGPKKAGGLSKARKAHRITSIVVALFTLMFTFSGAYHAFSKLKEDDRANYFTGHFYKTASIHFDIQKLTSIAKTSAINVGIVTINGEDHWRLLTGKANEQPTPAPKDLMKKMAAPMPTVVYISVADERILSNGEIIYANSLATQFSGRSAGMIVSTTGITKFGSEYNFADKRLPVWKIQYADNHNERYFIETSTGALAKKINDIGIIEDYSFGFLHKHEFLGWAGKGWKDFSTMFWAMAQVIMVTVGLVLFFKWRKTQKKRV